MHDINLYDVPAITWDGKFFTQLHGKVKVRVRKLSGDFPGSRVDYL
jgi:hypothetical protein